MSIARQRVHLPPKGWRRAMLNGLKGRLWEGDAVAQFESVFANYIGVAEAVAVPSGRAGLRFIYDALGLEKGAEVICSAFAYPVVPHLTRALGHDVRFADCELQTLGMDPDSLAQVISDKTRVVITTHLYGVPCRIREIREISSAHGAILIEDSAHCYGASVGGRKTGAFGEFGYFSFETSKPINTMGGGMVTTQDREMAARIREVARRESAQTFKWLAKRLSKTTFESLVTHPLPFNLGVYPALRFLASREGKEDQFASGYHADEITMKGRMGTYTNYQALLGLDQAGSIAPQLERRIHNARRLITALDDVVQFQSNDDPEVESNYMLVTALFPRMLETARRLLKLGIDSKHHYMRDCSLLLDGTPSFERAAQAEREVLHLPAYPDLNDRQIDFVASRVRQAIEELRDG